MMSTPQLEDKLIKALGIDDRMGSASAIFTMSTILKRCLYKVGIPDSVPIHVLGNRVDTNRFRPAKEIHDLPADKLVLVFVGRILPLKNVHGVLRACEILLDRGWSPQLHVVGSLAEPERVSYLNESLSTKIRPYVTIHGVLPTVKLIALYQRADMYVGPSFWEGFQIPLIEAMACGLPSVVSNQEPATDIIPKDGGAFVDPDSPESIADGIETLKRSLSMPGARAAMVRRLRLEAENKWNYDRISRREVDVYSSVLKTHYED